MHLLLESNFVLEMVKGQEQAEACGRLLAAAEAGVITLHLPAFCLMEPVYTMGALSKERQAMQRQVLAEIGQAERETLDKSALLHLRRSLTTTLQERDVLQQERLLEVSTRVAAVAVLIPFTHSIWLRAADLLATTALALPDALVSASILQQLETNQSLAPQEPATVSILSCSSLKLIP